MPRDRRSSRSRLVITVGIGVVAAALAVTAALLAGSGPTGGLIHDLTHSGPGSSSATVRGAGSDSEALTQAAQFFLDRYERPDGRVVRSDQGGDSVSEGQAYAMVVAVGLGDQRRFAAAWSWSRDHLMESDGLLAWRYSNGRVADPQPAADADLLSAWALQLAARRFANSSYRQAADYLSHSVQDSEVETVSGHPVLLAGTWARGPAPIANPSYFVTPAMRDLAGDDRRWTGVAAAADDFLRELLSGGHLPSDWAVVSPDGVAHPTAPPGQPGGSVVYGYDAVRLPVILAASCQSSERAMAASLWPTLSRDVSGGSPLVGLDLGGSPQAGAGDDAVGEVGAAAVAGAAGQLGAAGRFLTQAQTDNGRSPTYFGSAWVALGRLLLQSRALISCG